MQPLYLTKTKAHSPERALMRQMLQRLKRHNLAGPFLEPVDWESLGLNDYPSFVSAPMDLSTVEKKLKGKQYKYIEHFFNELMLIWHNCVTYNTQSHWLGQHALKLRMETKRFARNYFPNVKPDKPGGQHYLNSKNDQSKSKIEESESRTVPFKKNPPPPNQDEQATNKHPPSAVSQESFEYAVKERLLECLQLEQHSQNINKIYMMFQKRCPRAVSYDQQGTISVNLGRVDSLTSQQAIVQLQRWQNEHKDREMDNQDK